MKKKGGAGQLGLFEKASKAEGVARFEAAPVGVKAEPVRDGLTPEAARLVENFEVLAEAPGG